MTITMRRAAMLKVEPTELEAGDPAGRHAADAPMDEQDEQCKQADLIVLRGIVWIVDRGCR